MQIKKGIPVPATRSFGGGRPSRYPFNDMEVGDCIDVVVKETEEVDTVVRRMRVSATSWKKRAQAACGFAVRVVDENNEKVVRVWKTAPKLKKDDLFA